MRKYEAKDIDGGKIFSGNIDAKKSVEIWQKNNAICAYQKRPFKECRGGVA